MPELFQAHVLAPATEDVVDQTGSQPAQAQGRSDDRFVEPDCLGQLSDVAELALVDVLLPAECPGKRDDDRGFVHLAGIHDLVARPDASKLDGDADLQIPVFKEFLLHGSTRRTAIRVLSSWTVTGRLCSRERGKVQDVNLIPEDCRNGLDIFMLITPVISDSPVL